MAWNRTKRVAEFYPLISETSVATKEKIYKDQRMLQDIIRKLDYQRINVERQFDMEKRSIREELRTRVGTRTVQLDAMDWPKLRRLGLENAPRQVILTLFRMFPGLFHDTDTHLPMLSPEGTGCDEFDESSADQNLIRGLMAMIAPGRDKPLTPAQSVDRLIQERNITFMRTTDECKEKYKRDHVTFDPSLSFRQREYLRRQRSAKSARRRRSARAKSERNSKLARANDMSETDKDTARLNLEEFVIGDADKSEKQKDDSRDKHTAKKTSCDVTEVVKEDQDLERPSNADRTTLPDEIFLKADENTERNEETNVDNVGKAKSNSVSSPRRPRFTPDGRKREDVLRAVGELLQRSHTFPGVAQQTAHKEILSNEGRLTTNAETTTPTNARIDKGVSLRIRQKYLHEPRRQMLIRNVTQEKVTANRRLDRRSKDQHKTTLVPFKMTAPSLIGWHTIMQNSAHMAQNRNTFRRESTSVF